MWNQIKGRDNYQLDPYLASAKSDFVLALQTLPDTHGLLYYKCWDDTDVESHTAVFPTPGKKDITSSPAAYCVRYGTTTTLFMFSFFSQFVEFARAGQEYNLTDKSARPLLAHCRYIGIRVYVGPII